MPNLDPAFELHSFFRAIKTCPFADLVGPRSILRGAAEAVGRGGLKSSTRAAVVTLLDEFITQAASGQIDDDGGMSSASVDLRQQFRLILQGYGWVMRCLAVQGNVVDANSAREAARCFSDAWDVRATYNRPEQRQRDSERPQQDPLFQSIMDAFGDQWSVGDWTVWDMVRRLRQSPEKAADDEGNYRRASAPILLYEERRHRGRLALLHVSLRLGERGDFLPCPLELGAMFGRRMPGQPDGWDLSEEPNKLDFLASMRRAWQASGLATVDCRGRWWVTEYRSDQVQDEPIQTPFIEGRSAEAAACCAIWAAYGGVPGEGTPLNSMPLDLERPLTAQLGGNGGSLRDRF
jgi:hypothetical protein